MARSFTWFGVVVVAAAVLVAGCSSNSGGSTIQACAGLSAGASCLRENTQGTCVTDSSGALQCEDPLGQCALADGMWENGACTTLPKEVFSATLNVDGETCVAGEDRASHINYFPTADPKTSTLTFSWTFGDSCSIAEVKISFPLSLISTPKDYDASVLSVTLRAASETVGSSPTLSGTFTLRDAALSEMPDSMRRCQDQPDLGFVQGSMQLAGERTSGAQKAIPVQLDVDFLQHISGASCYL